MKHVKTYERINDYLNAYSELQKIKSDIEEIAVYTLSARPKREKQVMRKLDEVIEDLKKLKEDIELAKSTKKYNL